MNDTINTQHFGNTEYNTAGSRWHIIEFSIGAHILIFQAEDDIAWFTMTILTVDDASLLEI